MFQAKILNYDAQSLQKGSQHVILISLSILLLRSSRRRPFKINHYHVVFHDELANLPCVVKLVKKVKLLVTSEVEHLNAVFKFLKNEHRKDVHSTPWETGYYFPYTEEQGK